MKKFLFAGCGSIGRRHIRNLKALGSCKILAYRVRNEDLGDFGRQNDIQVFQDLEKALAEKPEAVFVTNPTRFHLSIAKAAAEKNCPIFIEKPISHTLEGVDDFIRLCRQKRITVMLGYKMRFHPSIRLIKSLLEKKIIGRVIWARAHYGGYLPDWHPWEDYRRMYSSKKELGGGVVLDASHEIDYLYWLLGDVGEVKAFTGKLSNLEIDTEDTAEISLRFKSGALGNIFLTYAQRPESRSCEIVGDEGSIQWDQDSKRVRLYEASKRKWEEFLEPEMFDPNQIFVDELREFLSAIEEKREPIHSIEDSKRVLEIALAARGAYG